MYVHPGEWLGRDSGGQINQAIRRAEQQMRAHTKRAKDYYAKGDAGKAVKEISAGLSWSAEFYFLENLKAIHESQRGVPLSYDQYPITRIDPLKGSLDLNNRWRFTPQRQYFKGSGEKEGSFCLGTARGMPFRHVSGLELSTCRQVLRDLKEMIETAKKV